MIDGNLVSIGTDFPLFLEARDLLQFKLRSRKVKGKLAA
jgi:hypothetical protein